ncbi:MAG: hypothetical protein ACI8VE_001698, partial [Natrialbaceae archaeon]
MVRRLGENFTATFRRHGGPAGETRFTADAVIS